MSTEIVIESWNCNYEIICFEVTGSRSLMLLPGTYDGVGEFVRLHPESKQYVFTRMCDWLKRVVK